MSTRCVAALRKHSAWTILALLVQSTFLASPNNAQTTQPFLFAETTDAKDNPTGCVTLLRDPSTGVLTMAPNSAVSFKDPCYPLAMDPTGHFLFGPDGQNQGLVMYTLDAATGIIAETPTSPYFVSITPGEYPALVATESTGHYVYLLKSDFASPGAATFTLDTFQIDSATPSLIAANSQSLNLNVSWGSVAADPNGHGFFVFGNQQQSGTSPTAVLFAISFDPSTGLPNIPTSGLNVGNNAQRMAISPTGNYLAAGWGDTTVGAQTNTGSVTIYQISPTSLNLGLVGNLILPPQFGGVAYIFPQSPFFSPGGDLFYVQGWIPSYSGGGEPFLVFDPSTLALLPTTPIDPGNANFLNGLMDPQAPFSYTGNPSPTLGISVYQIDLSTGLPSQPAPISAPFFTQLGSVWPTFIPFTPGGQGIQGPTLGITPGALTFGATNVGQSSAPHNVVLKSLGNESVSLTSIQFTGANASDFTETDNCLSAPVLATNHTCTIAVTYAPVSAGTSQANLVITDNASGSPQQIPLTGTANAVPLVPAVTLNPASTLAFPGTPTEGTSTLPQNVVLTNSGNAALQISNVALSGANAPDFSISTNNCSGSIAAGATCTVSIVFSPLAADLRLATLVFTDNAPNSPQSLNISGTAIAAATVAAAPNGTTSAFVSAGQPAQYNLQATPGAGFTGTLTFACSGAPTGAVCKVPSSISVTSGAATNFTVTVSTSGAAAGVPYTSRPQIPRISLRVAMTVLLCLLLLLLTRRSMLPGRLSPLVPKWQAGLACVFFLIALAGCGGGSSTPPPPPVITPSGTYTITVTPTATASGSTKALALSPIPLTLTVK